MITVANLEKNFGHKVLYNNLSFGLNPTLRSGIIGPNGAGKSVFLRIIAGEEKIYNGTISIPSTLKIGYLPQEMNISDLSALPVDYALLPFQDLFNSDALLKRMSEMTDTDSPEYHVISEEYDALQKQLAVYDVYSLNSRAEVILTGLGLSQEQLSSPLSDLSGGFRMRVVLAQLLLQEPDFLLLDEPTNHLDMDSLIWLERFLLRFKGGMLLVSHDRDFLNRITNQTIEIAGGQVTQYTGNYDNFMEWRAEFRETEAKRAKNIQDKIDQTERFITRFKSKNTKATQARSKMKVLDKLKDELPEQELSLSSIRFEFPEPTRTGSVPLKVDSATVAYDDFVVFENLSLSVLRGEKVAVIGPNGAGKSTLLKTFAQVLHPKSGSLVIGSNVEVRYYSQHRLDQLDPEKNLYDTVASCAANMERTQVQSILGAFLFSNEDVLKKVKVLSGGEKSRLSLATLLADPGNVLLLDEPTNHLDILSIECLSEAIKKFAGTVITVSHDEFFLSQTATRIIEIRHSNVRDFPGNLKDYREYVLDGLGEVSSATEIKEEKKEVVNEDKQDRINKRKQRKTVERKIDKIEKSIASLEESISTKEEELNNPADPHNYEHLTNLQKEIASLHQEYEAVMEEWEACQVELEELG